MHIIISAKSMDEVEQLMKVIEKWTMFHFNDHIKRRTSWSPRANGRAQIIAEIDPDMWEYIRRGATSECVQTVKKSISAYSVMDNVTEFCTEEVEI